VKIVIVKSIYDHSIREMEKAIIKNGVHSRFTFKMLFCRNKKPVALATCRTEKIFTIEDLNNISLKNIKDWTSWINITRKAGFMNFNELYDFVEKHFKETDALSVIKIEKIWLLKDMFANESKISHANREYFEEVKFKSNKDKNGRRRVRSEWLKNECVGKIIIK